MLYLTNSLQAVGEIKHYLLNGIYFNKVRFLFTVLYLVLRHIN